MYALRESRWRDILRRVASLLVQSSKLQGYSSHIGIFLCGQTMMYPALQVIEEEAVHEDQDLLILKRFKGSLRTEEMEDARKNRGSPIQCLSQAGTMGQSIHRRNILQTLSNYMQKWKNANRM